MHKSWTVALTPLEREAARRAHLAGRLGPSVLARQTVSNALAGGRIQPQVAERIRAIIAGPGCTECGSRFDAPQPPPGSIVAHLEAALEIARAEALAREAARDRAAARFLASHPLPHVPGCLCPVCRRDASPTRPEDQVRPPVSPAATDAPQGNVMAEAGSTAEAYPGGLAPVERYSQGMPGSAGPEPITGSRE